MSDYSVIAEVSKTLQQTLWAAYAADPVTKNIVGTVDAIVFDNPNKTAQQSTNRLSLWLYHITENEYVKNQAPALKANGDIPRRPPLTLNLGYLLTPFGPSGESDLLILGKAMQTLYESAIFSVQNTAGPIAEDLRIVLCQLPLEDLGRIWEALQEPYRLSVCYQVRVVHIEPQVPTSGSRVVDRTAGFAPVPGPARAGVAP